MDKSSGKPWLPWLFPRSRALRTVSLSVVGAAALAAVGYVAYVVAVTGGFKLFTDLTNVDDERPPIIVSTGSLVFEGGDQSDSPHVKEHWNNWRQDVLSSHWKPDFTGGPDVDHYEVIVLSPAGCSTMTGDTVVVEFTRTDGGTPSPVAVTLNLHKKWPSGPVEPKLDPGDLTMDKTDVIRGPSGAPTFPSKLTFKADGYISRLTVSSTSGTSNPPCTFSQTDKVRIRVNQPKPPPPPTPKK